ncbi:MAG: 2,4-dihydroxyhept-2-ene-1,7-dioic acid aldolase [Gammaproteobacteria bacterium]|nr:2,4-dihydroxyhept-2-ene-1,7-dioic acid aldolase [Gammaproteobacteria bacterium]
MKPNPIRQKLDAGVPTIGTRIHSPWPAVIELIGHTGLYDYVEFVAEYGTFDLHDLDNMCRAAELYGLGMMFKIDRANQHYLSQRALGSGFGAVLFTDCRTGEDAQMCVRIAKPDTPEDNGLYSVYTRRNTYMGYGGGPEYVQAMRESVVALMIEKKEAVENLEQILAVKGVDMVQWGPADYSMNVGLAGKRSDPAVLDAKKQVFKTALEMGVQPRAEIMSPDEAKAYLDMGVRHFNMGVDISILHGWWRSNGDALRKAVEGS